MRATVRRFHSPDADLSSYWPEDDTHFGLLIQIMVGPVDGPGEESFEVVYCSPGWLAAEIERTGLLIGRHHLIGTTFDWAAAKRFLAGRVEAEEADTWRELAGRIGRIGRWEFEDHTRTVES